MTEKGYEKSWRFCDECQNVIHKHDNGIWPACQHDWRPNSPAGVMANQRKELESYGQFYNELFQGPRCYQSPHEIISMIAFARYRMDIREVVVEIGSYHGGTAHIFRRMLRPSKLICIDLNFEHWMAGDIATLIEGDTRAPETLGRLQHALGEYRIDLLFIDGDHSIDGARNDWEKFSPMVRPGGIIAFHDTGAIPEVKQVFDEVPGTVKINIVSFQGIGIIIK